MSLKKGKGKYPNDEIRDRETIPKGAGYDEENYPDGEAITKKLGEQQEQIQNCLSSDNIKTQAEYDALTTEEKNNGVIYAIIEV